MFTAGKHISLDNYSNIFLADKRILRLNRTDREFCIRKMYQELRSPIATRYIRDPRVAPEADPVARLGELGDPRGEWNKSSMTWDLVHDEEKARTTRLRESRS